MVCVVETDGADVSNLISSTKKMLPLWYHLGTASDKKNKLRVSSAVHTLTRFVYVQICRSLDKWAITTRKWWSLTFRWLFMRYLVRGTYFPGNRKGARSEYVTHKHLNIESLRHKINANLYWEIQRYRSHPGRDGSQFNLIKWRN